MRKTLWSNFSLKLFTAQKRLELTSSPNCSWTRPFLHCSMPFCTRRKAPWTNFNTLLYTAQSPLNQLQGIFVHVQSPLNQLQGIFVHDAKPLELTSRHFCTRAKPSCKRSKTFCSQCKPAWSYFKALLYTAQNLHANVQCPLFIPQNRITWTKIILISVTLRIDCFHISFSNIRTAPLK